MAALRPVTRALPRAPTALFRALRAPPKRFESSSSASDKPQHELGVGELAGAKFRIEPLRRTGEDLQTMRARLLCTLTVYPSLSISLSQVPNFSPDTMHGV